MAPDVHRESQGFICVIGVIGGYLQACCARWGGVLKEKQSTDVADFFFFESRTIGSAKVGIQVERTP